MSKIKYVGVKLDGETAFTAAAKMADPWMPGDVREVEDEKLVAQMLQHPDVFARDGKQPAKEAPAPAPAPAPESTAALQAPLDEDTNTGGSLAPGAEVAPAATPAPTSAPKAAAKPATKAAGKTAGKRK